MRGSEIRPQGLYSGLALWPALVAPPISAFLESFMPTHVLVQLPLLALAGWLIGAHIRKRIGMRFISWNHKGATALSIVIVTLIYWMIPRFLDDSLVSSTAAIGKYLSIPMLIGAPLGVWWPSFPGFLKGVLQVKVLAMLIFLSWLYHAAPVQLCNNYVRDEQIILSAYLLKLFFLLAAIFALQPLFGISIRKICSSLVSRKNIELKERTA